MSELYYLGKPIKDEYKPLMDYLEYTELRYVSLPKVWQQQHMLEIIEDIYDYLKRLNYQGVLLKE